ncbi:MAG: metal-sulfur cluster assembly factor [Deltaproteobacteria bacterium]|nr:metal-sulfur cluster assembly factor [Deltaproteobacteria bacterium]
MNDSIMNQLKNVIDPELGISIVDLGLIRKIELSEDGNASIDMTLTTPGCPIGPQLMAAVKYHAEQVDGVCSAEVHLTFSPPWNPDRDATQDGKFQLSMLM